MLNELIQKQSNENTIPPQDPFRDSIPAAANIWNDTTLNEPYSDWSYIHKSAALNHKLHLLMKTM